MATQDLVNQAASDKPRRQRNKLRLVGLHQADTEGKQFVVQFSRPMSILEVRGLEQMIISAMEDASR